MDGEHILTNMKHLHSDVTRQTMEAADRLEKMAVTVAAAADRVEGISVNVETALNRAIASLPGATNKEMERAGREVITALSAEVGKTAQQVAGNAALAAQNESFAFASLVLTGSFVIFFGAGMFLGTHDAGRLATGLICLLVGAGGGIVLGYLMSIHKKARNFK